jgi:serine/threonine protein kinase
MLAAMKRTEGSEEHDVQPPPPIEDVAAAFPQLEITELIGQGGMGCVFKARQPRLNRLVALKLLPASLAQRDPAFAGRFEREGQLLARLHHPNIVAVHDSGTAGEFFYLTMEYVDGVNLRQAMRARRFTPPQALAIVPLICDALQYAHDEGVLHRDIKPENILLDARGRVKLADFGIAKLVAEADLAATGATPAGAGLTHSGAALGTPSYMAPEQRETPNDIDHRADIYSLGVVFYELLTGELPRGRFTPPSARSEADPRVDPIVQQALEKDRDRRQRSAGEVRTQVTSLGEAGAAATRRSSRTRLALAVLLLVLAVVAPLAVMSRLDQSVQRRSSEQLARIKQLQQQTITINTQIADAQASAGRAASRAGNSALPEQFRKEASEEQKNFEERAGKARMDLAFANAKLEDLMSMRTDSNRRSSWLILLTMAPLGGGGLFLLTRNGNTGIALVAGAALLLLSVICLGLQSSRRESRWPASPTSRQSQRAAFPRYASITRDGASAYLAHDDADLHYAMFYPGSFIASTSGSQNWNGLVWRDSSAIKLANGRSFGLGRDSANDLFLTINGVEYDLRKGRLFVLNDDGTVLQRDMHPSLEQARDPKKLQQLAAREESPETASISSGVEAGSANRGSESWSYTPRYLTQERVAQWRQSPKVVEADWFQDISVEERDGVITLTGPRDRVRRVATMLRVLDQPEVKSLAELPSLNMGPDFFTRIALPDLMMRSDFSNAPMTTELLSMLSKAGVSASQLGRALSAHVLELERAEFVNRGVPFEQIVKSPGASTHYEATIPCADRPGQPLTLRIERTTQQIGTQSSFDALAPWLVEEAKTMPGEPR